jgi:exopolysaccharide biosynthesis polyprenyl glycosylphosphotransferase
VITTAGLLLLAVIATLFVRQHSCAERALIIGATPLARKLVDEIAARHYGHAVVVDDDPEPEEALGDLYAGPLARLGEIIDAWRPHRIVIALADRRGRLPMRELVDARVKGVVIEDAVQFYERLTGKIAIEALTPSHLISSPDFRKSHLDLAFGHALSLFVSVTALVVLAPLFLAIALAIKIDSPGPVLFVHDRVGLRGRRFKLLKFRTMRPADRATSEWVRDNRGRITRVGRWLRAYRLDELPQLINVLRGELNLIGPRPHPVSNFELFLQRIPYYALRSVVRPGLTGWAQVRQGYANNLEEETEKMRYDLYYIKHMSAWLDLRILALTVQAVLSGRESPDDDAARPAGAADPYALSGRLMTSPALVRSVTTSPPQ